MKRISYYLNELARNSDFFYELKPEEKDKLKKVLLEMFKDIQSVCDKYDIEIMLAGGSCLGAVRHQGYIPWDDDFDMMMSRDNYDKFISVFDKELSDKYELSVPRRQTECKTLFMQMIKKGTTLLCADDLSKEDSNGIRVDFYAIEKMPDNDFIRELKFKYLDFIRICAISTNIYSTNNKLFKKAFSSSIGNKVYYYIRYFIGLVFSLFGRKRLYDYFDRVASSSNGSKYCSIPTGRGLCKKECHLTEVFFPPQKAMFEGMEVLIPNKVDQYLSSLYGDYMKVPPPEKRERHFYVKLDFGE